ncbi:DUF6446 family protein [Paracoccus xiamenensis]|uniref:DUF6446 family protein n=1 Tax=Paracoccus xiamenensis TaxID=2714901 RepID=UPI00140B0733|nr:DUF6446 family protein [Paracoccus xiamenensis]NHF71960.1 histidine kinase [Paracoccus xiamenensis]
MTAGKIMASMIVLSALLAGLAVYYLQVYGFYEPLDEAAGAAEIRATADDMQPIPLGVTEFRGIDADSSPLRYRSCFRITDMAALQDAQQFEGATPLVGPRWFSCFSAKGLTADLESGAAVAYLGQSEIHPDVDRVIAVYPDGRAFAWHQINDKTPERGVMD